MGKGKTCRVVVKTKDHVTPCKIGERKSERFSYFFSKKNREKNY